VAKTASKKPAPAKKAGISRKKLGKTKRISVPAKPLPKRLVKPVKRATSAASKKPQPVPARSSRLERRSSVTPELPRTAPADDGGAILAPVPSNDKPRKNLAGLSSKELEHFRDLLLAKRREILGDMSSMEREALRSSGGTNLSTLPIHMADMGTDNYEQEFTLGLVETERKLLREINNALAKVQNGTYGLCEGTTKPITKARLEVQPWARYSIEYAKQMERMGRSI
jgi:RNA polymerase-binding protein DksA